jgi:hypothetical protein
MKLLRRHPALLATALLGALVAAPLAIAAGPSGPVDGGARNPSANQSQAYTQETEIIANNGTYGTRQSNKSDNGGGAIYGCRSGEGGTLKGNEPCVRAHNLAKGFAFEFESDGLLGGTIVVGNGGDGAVPFTTNATGVAAGLNADRVDGKNADDFLAAGGKAADADKLDGRDSGDFAAAGDLLSAAVGMTGTLTGGRGAKSAALTTPPNTFTVTFDKDVSKCTFTATKNADTAGNDDTLAAVATSGTPTQVTVDEGSAVPFPFHLQVIC